MEQTNNPQNITLYGCSEYLPHGRRRFRRTDPVESRKSRPAVRATRANDYFLTITESRKKTAPDGTVSYDRHKIFLYKEDFSKFLEGLEEVIGFIKREKPEFFEEEHPKPEEYA
mgnify:CR=1 FL=1